MSSENNFSRAKRTELTPQNPGSRYSGPPTNTAEILHTPWGPNGSVLPRHVTASCDGIATSMSLVPQSVLKQSARVSPTSFRVLAHPACQSQLQDQPAVGITSGITSLPDCHYHAREGNDSNTDFFSKKKHLLKRSTHIYSMDCKAQTEGYWIV